VTTAIRLIDTSVYYIQRKGHLRSDGKVVVLPRLRTHLSLRK
jgi:hypothetical protein